MRIKLSRAGKRFNREWIFRNADLEFLSSGSYAITGPNGSGKSTLLQCIGGMLQLSEGNIDYLGDGAGEKDRAFEPVSLCAPYMDVIEEMTLLEFLQFHGQFKPFLAGFSIGQIVAAIGLDQAAGKQIRYYSSGMKQRVKLAQAIFSDVPVVLLDEPCSNLDTKGIDLYHSLIDRYCRERIVIVCSNDAVEYAFCQTVLAITDFKGTTTLSPR